MLPLFTCKNANTLNVNEANIVYKRYTHDHLNYALKSFNEQAQKRTISAPLQYFKAVLEKVNPEKYINEADLKLFTIVDTAEEAVNHINNFYTKYLLKPNLKNLTDSVLSK